MTLGRPAHAQRAQGLRGSLTFRSIVASGVLLGIVVGGFLIMAIAVRSLQSADRVATRSTQVRTTADELETSVIDLETGLRGYLLAGRTRFLQPYHVAIAMYPGLAAQLRALTAGDPLQHARAARLDATIGDYINDWSQPVIARATHHLRAARAAEASGGGKLRIDAIRAQFSVFNAEEARLGAVQTRQADHLGTVALMLALAGMVVCGLLVIALAFGLRWLVVTPVRDLADAVRRVGSGELSVRVTEQGSGEVGELTRGFNRMVSGLELHHDELENQKAELEAQQAELETALETVEEQKAHTELLQCIGDELAAASGVDEVSHVILREMGDFARAEVGAIYVLDEAEDQGEARGEAQAEAQSEYALAGSRGLPTDTLRTTVTPGVGLAGRALSENRPIALTAQASLRLPGLTADRPVVHELHLPLLHGERNVGVVSLGRVSDEAFSADELAVLAGLSQRAAGALVEALSRHALEGLAHEMQTLLGSTGEAIYGTDREGRVTLVNRAALEQTGYSREELIGQSAHELLHHTRPDGEPYPAEDCPVKWSIDNGEGCRIEDEVFWRKDGSPFPVEYSAYPLFDGDQVTGAVVVSTDISARKVAERQRDTQHSVTRVLAEARSVPEALPAVLQAVCDGLGLSFGIAWQPLPDGTGLRSFASYARPGHEADAQRVAAAGVLRDQLPAGAAMTRHQPVLCAEIETAARTGASHKPLQSAVAMPILSLGGELIGVAECFSAQPLDAAGLLDTLSSVAGQTAQYIERKRGEAETERMREEFVATVSHELRTPLTAIDGWLHILLGEEAGPLNAEQQRFLRTVKRNSDRLIRLVGDLLLAGQIESGQFDLELDELDLGRLAHEAVDLVSASAAAKQIELDLEIAGDGPATVRGDRSRLLQLLGNLLSNAVKFTPEAGRVTVEVLSADELATLTVSDSGIGIPPDERSRLFERFFRASSATERAISGTGLGLAISKAIAESHGGTIRVADHDGPGTVFVVELPLAVREELPL